MTTKKGWILSNVACESCGGKHDLFFEEEPVIHRDFIFTCPETDTSARVRILTEPEPVDEQPPDAILANVI